MSTATQRNAVAKAKAARAKRESAEAEVLASPVGIKRTVPTDVVIRHDGFTFTITATDHAGNLLKTAKGARVLVTEPDAKSPMKGVYADAFTAQQAVSDQIAAALDKQNETALIGKYFPEPSPVAKAAKADAVADTSPVAKLMAAGFTPSEIVKMTTEQIAVLVA